METDDKPLLVTEGEEELTSVCEDVTREDRLWLIHVVGVADKHGFVEMPGEAVAERQLCALPLILGEELTRGDVLWERDGTLLAVELGEPEAHCVVEPERAGDADDDEAREAVALPHSRRLTLGDGVEV